MSQRRPKCQIILAGRATSVPFAAVATGAAQTARDNTIAGVACTVLRPRR
jgi:hypothetical protein